VRPFVRVYIEGGAEGRAADRDFRRGWQAFLKELHELAVTHGYNSLRVVRGKGRDSTYRRFVKHRNTYPRDLCVLLVDAETTVPEAARVWDIVG